MTYDVLSPGSARLFPYLPDFRSGFDVSRTYKTDIALSRDNTEQRRAIRFDPRISVDYRTTVSDADRRAADHFMRAWTNKPAIIKDFARWARIDGGVSGGATAFTLDPMPPWVGEGQNLVLCGDGETETVLVASVAGTTVNLEDPLSNAWPDGSVVRPTFFGLMDGRITSSRPNRAAAQFSINLECYPGGEPSRAAGSAWATLGDREVFTPTPDYASPPQVNWVWPMDRIDYGQGRTAQFRPVAEVQRIVECDFSGLSVARATEFEQFFDRHKGRRNAFYLPTWEKDYLLNASAGSGTATFTATGPAIAADFGSTDYSAVDEGVAVFLTDGTAIYRRITDISASGGNSVVTVSANWGANLTAANVARISRLLLVRFASDEMVTSWASYLTASVRHGFQQVKA